MASSSLYGSSMEIPTSSSVSIMTSIRPNSKLVNMMSSSLPGSSNGIPTSSSVGIMSSPLPGSTYIRIKSTGRGKQLPKKSMMTH